MVIQRGGWGGGDLLVKFLKLLNDEQWPWTWSIKDIKGVQSKTVVSRRFYSLNMRKILVVNTWGSKQTSGPPVTGEHNPRAIIGGLRFWWHQCVWYLLVNTKTALPNHNISYHASLPGFMWTLKATLWWCIGKFKADCFINESACSGFQHVLTIFSFRTIRTPAFSTFLHTICSISWIFLCQSVRNCQVNLSDFSYMPWPG